MMLKNDNHIVEIIGVTVSVLTLVLLFERHQHDIRHAQIDKDLKKLQIELNKEQLIALKDKNGSV